MWRRKEMESLTVEIEEYDWRRALWNRRSSGAVEVVVMDANNFLASKRLGELKITGDLGSSIGVLVFLVLPEG